MEIKLTRLQEQKIKHLLEKGAVVKSAVVTVETEFGIIATVDQFGRVTWGENYE